MAKDGFAKFRDFGQFWHGAGSRRFRPLSHAPPPCHKPILYEWDFRIVCIFLTLIITILKLDFVQGSAQNYAHKLSLASRRADSHGHILSKSSTNLEKWGGVQKKVRRFIFVCHCIICLIHSIVIKAMHRCALQCIASSLNQRRICLCWFDLFLSIVSKLLFQPSFASLTVPALTRHLSAEKREDLSIDWFAVFVNVAASRVQQISSL